MRALAVVVLGVTVAAAAPGAGEDPGPELVVEIRMAAPCPSVLGCDQEVRLRRPDGTIQEPMSPDGADASAEAGARLIRFAVAPGTVQLEMTVSVILARTIDGDLISVSMDELARCSMDLDVPRPRAPSRRSGPPRSVGRNRARRCRRGR